MAERRITRNAQRRPTAPKPRAISSSRRSALYQLSLLQRREVKEALGNLSGVIRGSVDPEPRHGEGGSEAEDASGRLQPHPLPRSWRRSASHWLLFPPIQLSALCKHPPPTGNRQISAPCSSETQHQQRERSRSRQDQVRACLSLIPTQKKVTSTTVPSTSPH